VTDIRVLNGLHVPLSILTPLKKDKMLSLMNTWDCTCCGHIKTYKQSVPQAQLVYDR